MDDSALKEARVRAEKAVAGMAEGEMKVKAFEVILSQLITSGPTTGKATLPLRNGRHFSSPNREGQPKSLAERILALQADGFFKEPQTIGGVREGLKTRGWHYPVTTLSGALQIQTQKRRLRRQRVRDKNKTMWQYFDP